MKAVRKNKRGVTLAIVMVIAMALLIFSSALFAAASHNLDLTGRSVDGRQAYLTAKSAIEYAKTVVYRQAKSGSLQSFSVKPGAADGLFAEGAAGGPPDGVSVLAACTVSGEDVKISAKVKNKNSDGYQKLSYSCQVHRETAGTPLGLPASEFFLSGVQYGSQSVFQCGFWPTFYGKERRTASLYPVVENLPVYAYQSGAYVKAPEVFLMGDSAAEWKSAPAGHYSLASEAGETEIHSGFTCIAWDIWAAYYTDSDKASLKLYPDQDGETAGIIRFSGKNGGKCTVQTGGNISRAVSIPAGYYRFEAGINLLTLSSDGGAGFADVTGKSLTKLTEAEQNAAEMKTFATDVTFAESNAADMISGERWDNYKGAQFAPDSVFGAGVSNKKESDGLWHANNGGFQMDDKTVYTYANRVQWPATCPWPWYDDAYGSHNIWWGQYSIYCAKRLFLQFVSPSDDFALPGYNIVFRADAVSLNMRKTDTDAGAGTDDRPSIVQASGAPSSEFIVTSSSRDEGENYKDVTLVVGHDMKVFYNNNAESYEIEAGVYQVPSGFNFFDGDTQHRMDSLKKISDSPPGGVSGGGSGGTGGFTVSGGVYSKS